MSYKCANCHKSFTSKQGLLDHWQAKQHYPDLHSNYCYQCDRPFTSKIGLVQVCQSTKVKDAACATSHSTANGLWIRYLYLSSELVAPYEVTIVFKHEETYCHHCERQFQTGNAREQHYKEAAVHRGRYCSECQWIFDEEDEKKMHDETYHEYEQWHFDGEDEEEMHDKSYYWHGYDDGVEVESLQSEEDEEVARRIAIEESRRKLAELEADKPLWEAAAKRRSMREEAERESIRVKATTLNKAEAEAERKARTLREAEEKRKADEQRQREAAARRERERQQQRWAYGTWTTDRAFERYKVLSQEFDSTKFSADLPLIIEAVPWPILTSSPARLNIADVDWDAVETFFTLVKNLMKPQEYKVLVEKSHRRFHPDRWQSRNLWKTVVDETERDDMKVAVNTVAQALTPIWRTVTGR